MKAGELLDTATAQALSLEWLIAAVAPASDYGDRVFARLSPYAPGQEAAARARADRIAGVAAAIDAEKLDVARDALRGAPDASSAIARASMGDALSDANFLELQRFFDAIDRVDTLLADAPLVETIAEGAVRSAARALELGRAGSFGFYLDDRFDATLASARTRLAQVQAELDAVRGRAAQRAARALGRDDVSGDEFIVMRANLDGPLPPGVRVLREAPTYVLCALEYDDATLSALERRDAAAEAAAAAEEHVRVALSSIVRSNAAALDAAAQALGELDVLVAAARFCQRYACAPATIALETVVSFLDGRFLPLAAELELEGRAFTPVELELHDVAVLTGPNMGGKSVCLKTCGFIALCAAFGLPVPAQRARVGLFDEIAWLGIGGAQEQGGLLSSFAQEVVRLRTLLERGAPRLFVLIDEFARTTTPHEGKALLVALLARLRERGACGLAATHLAGVAGQAQARHFAVRGLRGIPVRPPDGDLHHALAALAASMDYTVGEVAGDDAARADAIALAALLGLDDDLIESAYAWLRDPADGLR
jgi:DNA mismatch repair protein MutS2